MSIEQESRGLPSKCEVCLSNYIFNIVWATAPPRVNFSSCLNSSNLFASPAVMRYPSSTFTIRIMSSPLILGLLLKFSRPSPFWADIRSSLVFSYSRLQPQTNRDNSQAWHLFRLAAISEQKFDSSLDSDSVRSRVLIARHFRTTLPYIDPVILNAASAWAHIENHKLCELTHPTS